MRKAFPLRSDLTELLAAHSSVAAAARAKGVARSTVQRAMQEHGLRTRRTIVPIEGATNEGSHTCNEVSVCEKGRWKE